MAGNVDRVTLSIEAPAIRVFGHGMREKCGFFAVKPSALGLPCNELNRDDDPSGGSRV
jgi:hypothetical protein